MWRSKARFQYARLLFSESWKVSLRRHRGLIKDALSVCDRLWDVIKHALCPLPNSLSLFLPMHVSLYLPLPLAVFLCCVMVFILQLCHCLLLVVLNGILHLHQRESLMWSVKALTVSDCVQKEKSGKEKWPNVTLCSLSVNWRKRWCPSSLHSKCICHFLFYLKTFQAHLSSFTTGWCLCGQLHSPAGPLTPHISAFPYNPLVTADSFFTVTSDVALEWNSFSCLPISRDFD